MLRLSAMAFTCVICISLNASANQVLSDNSNLNNLVRHDPGNQETISPLQAAFNSVPNEYKMQIQAYLQDKGFYSYVIDGIWGMKTKLAIEAYASQNQISHLLTSEPGAKSLLANIINHYANEIKAKNE